MQDQLAHRIDPDLLAGLPRAPGVYLFRGEGVLPLYIGKSMDIRNRVLTHLRDTDKARMIAQARTVEVIETAGDIGAQLLEARLIKQFNPLFNIRLRRLKKLFSIQLSQEEDGFVPRIATSRDSEAGQIEGLFGLFRSRHAASDKLADLAREHQLCHGLLGLEKLGKRGCFGVQIKTCRGACIGGESRFEHDQRLCEALGDLKVHIWPYRGPVDVVERHGDWVQRHRIAQWRHLGTWCSRTNRFEANPEQGFDLDTYKILAKPVMLNEVAVEEVS